MTSHASVIGTPRSTRSMNQGRGIFHDVAVMNRMARDGIKNHFAGLSESIHHGTMTEKLVAGGELLLDVATLLPATRAAATELRAMRWASLFSAPASRVVAVSELDSAIVMESVSAEVAVFGAEKISELDMLRKATNTGAFSELKVPMQHKIVHRIAQEAGVGLDSINIKIIRDPELLKLPYLDRTTPKGEIELYPNAFSDIETLVKTLGHERTHVYQVKSFGHPDSLMNGFEHLQLNERAAYILENNYWQCYQANKSGLFDQYGDQYVSRLAKNYS